MRHEIQVQGTRCHLFRYNSISEFTDAVRSVEPIFTNRATQIARPRTHSSFAGRNFSEWSQIYKAVQSLWPQGMDIYSSMMNELQDEQLPQPRSIKRRKRWSEDGGDELDIDRLRSDRPYWRTTHRDAKPGPLNVTILTDVSTSSYVKADKILWRGAAAICLTNILEEAGYRVELQAVNHVTGAYADGTGHACSVCLKESQDPLDVSSLINVVSGWSFRFLYFAAYWQKDLPYPLESYGYPAPVRRIQSHLTPDEQTVVVENVWDRGAAVQWVRNQIENITQV